MPYLAERELAQATREKLPARAFVFPKDKTWPIHDEKHAKLALIWSTWPQHKSVAKQVRDAVFKRYKGLKNWFKGGKYAKESAEKMGVTIHEAAEMKRRSIVEAESGFGTLGDLFRERIEATRDLLNDGSSVKGAIEEGARRDLDAEDIPKWALKIINKVHAAIGIDRVLKVENMGAQWTVKFKSMGRGFGMNRHQMETLASIRGLEGIRYENGTVTLVMS